MKLRELLNIFLRPKGPWTQVEIGEMLNLPQWKISAYANAADESDLEKNWQAFLRLSRLSTKFRIVMDGTAAQILNLDKGSLDVL